VHQVQRPFRDIDGQVAHALEIIVNFDRRGNETKVDRHGLLQRQQASRQLVDLDFHLVDPRLILLHLSRQRFVLFDEGLDASLNGGLHERAHFQQPFSDFF
jgi:hypothetical protein